MGQPFVLATVIELYFIYGYYFRKLPCISFIRIQSYKSIKRGIRLGLVSISSKQLISYCLSRVGATHPQRISVYIFLIIIFKVVNYIFLIVISKIVNYMLYIVYLLVLNPRHTIKKISLKARKSR